MLLAVRIVGVIYIAAMAVMAGLWYRALRQPLPSDEAGRDSTNIIPFRGAPARSGAGEAAES